MKVTSNKQEITYNIELNEAELNVLGMIIGEIGVNQLVKIIEDHKVCYKHFTCDISIEKIKNFPHELYQLLLQEVSK